MSALYIFIGRILRPIWDTYITKCTSYKENSYINQEAMWNEKQRRVVQYKLLELKNFLNESEAHLFDLHLESKLHFMKSREYIESLRTNERKKIKALSKLVIKAMEALELLSFMDDQATFDQVQGKLTIQSQQALAEITFKEILYKEFAGEFIINIVTHCLTEKKYKGADVLKLAAELYQRCPCYFTRSCYEVFKAEIMLEKAVRSSDDKAVVNNKVKEATRILFEFVESVDIERIVPLLLSLEQFYYTVKLCLLSGEREDEKTTESKEYKKLCYSYIIDLLSEMHEVIMNKKSSRMNFAWVIERIPYERLIEIEQHIIEESVKISQNKTFHITLFLWLHEENMIDKLININSPYLEDFIESKFGSNDLPPNKILYKYYMAKKSYKKATEALYRLAIYPSTITLEDRMQYLNLALDCIENINKGEAVEFRSSIEGLKDMARIQMSAIHQLKELYEKTKETKKKQMIGEDISALESYIIDIDNLLERFAKNYELWEIGIKVLVFEMQTSNIQQKHIDELVDYYTSLIKKVYQEDPLEWPNSVIKKLTDLATLYHWPTSTKPLHHFKDVVEDQRRVREYLFPLKSIVIQVETINMKHFEKNNAIAMEISIETHIEAPAFWVISFLRNHPMKMSYEDIYRLYEELENQDAGNSKWELRMQTMQIICCVRWIFSIKENQYDVGLTEKIKGLIIKAIKSANANLEVLGKVVSPYIKVYTTELLNKVNEWMLTQGRNNLNRRIAVRRSGTIFAEKLKQEDNVKQFLESLDLSQ